MKSESLKYLLFICGVIVKVIACADSDANLVKYLIYNRAAINSPEIVTTVNLTSSRNYNPELETKIIIHGYNSGCNESVGYRNKNAFLIKYEVNVICVDWTSMTGGSLFTAIFGIDVVVNNLTDFIIRLKTRPNKIHILGHSFGSHIAGSTAEKLSAYHYGKIARITSLDPASVMLWINGTTTRLSRQSADVVDVIHTESKILGTTHPIGHFDFYPNGGYKQPGCAGSSQLGCSHSRSHQLFAESIFNPMGFPSQKCKSVSEAEHHKCDGESKVLMGNVETYDLKEVGIYYVKTSPGPEYSRQQQRQERNSSDEDSSEVEDTINLFSFGLSLFLLKFFT